MGLIEKLQLSNSRKPVFRWRNRTAVELQQGSELAASEHAFQVKQEIQPLHDVTKESVSIKTETPSSCDLECQEDAEALKTSQSCDSDSFDDASDSLSDSSARGKTKRKYSEFGNASPAPSEDELAPKRSKTEAATSPSASTPASSESSTQATTAAQRAKKLLRFDASNVPVHPQIILHEQQEQVRVYMQQYIREYVDFLIVQQVRLDPSSSNTAASASSAGGSSVAADALGAEVDTPSIVESSVATITQDIHGTPVTMPSLTNRVTSDLAGSIHDLLFSTNTTSPQSVSDLLPSENRVANKHVPYVTISPARSSAPVSSTSSSSSSASPPLSKCPPLAPVQHSPSSSSPAAAPPFAKTVEVHDQPRKLLAELQSTTSTTH